MEINKDRRFGAYIAEAMIGEGGMAVVVRAHHESTGDLVALN